MISGRITGKPTNFNWLIEGKLAGSGAPTSFSEFKWFIVEKGIKTIVTIKDKPLPSEWFSRYRAIKGTSDNSSTIDYLHVDTKDYGAPSIEELDYVVNYIMHQIDDKGKSVIVHCSGGKGRTGTILAAYLLKRARQKDVLGIEERMDANQAIESLRNMRGESIQSQNQKDILYQYEAYLRNKNENQDVINR